MRKVFYIGGFDFITGNAAFTRAINVIKATDEKKINAEFFSIFYQKTLSDFEANSVKSKKKYSEQINIKVIEKSFLKEKPDVVICYNLPSILFFKVLRLKKVYNFKVISDCTEWYDTKASYKDVKE